MKTISTKAVKAVAPPPSLGHCLIFSAFDKFFKNKYNSNIMNYKSGFTLSEVTEPRHNIRHWSKGFTLAEVLITLGIIGVVAAITIPTLVQNYRNKAWSTASAVFERKLEEALRTMNTQQTLAGYNNTLDFVNELSKHFKIDKICKNNDILSCFEDKVTWGDEEVDISKIKNAKNFGQEDWDTETIGVQFANGVTGLIAYNPDCTQDPYSNQIVGTGCLAILYDVDGFKNPNTQNKDLHDINVKTLAGSSGNCLPGGFCITSPFIANPITYAECLELKDSLNINQCCERCNDKDYWAGAVKACGGLNKMLSTPQAVQIVEYIYDDVVKQDNDEGFNPHGYSGKLNDEKAASIGFNLAASSNLTIWLNEEYNQEAAFDFNFIKTGAAYDPAGYGRWDDFIYTVCIVD